MDFWVRTNAAGSYLVLEGNVLTTSETVRAMGIDIRGRDVELSTVTVKWTYEDENGATQTASESVKVYVITETDEDGNEKEAIYNADTNVRLSLGGVPTSEGYTISTPVPLMEEKVTIVGYEGENRIWNSEDKIFIKADSTTQGSGSCYVFYAEDPAQQENGLRLLSNMRIAFVDNNEGSATYGKMIALAKLDTENPYEENGKVTVPVVLIDDESEHLTKTENGLAITRLETNTPTKLLALVYLDGRKMQNADVLSSSEIDGQLNLQFGSTVELTPKDDSELEAARRTITAMIKKSTDDEYQTTDNAITYDYNTETGEMKVDVRIMVRGDNPVNASARFMRQVSATQGSSEESFVLYRSQTEAGVYEGSYTFTSPGNYILRTVMLDGISYNLPADNDAATNKEYPRVEISGFGINNITVSYDGLPVDDIQVIKTSGRNATSELTLQFSSDQAKLPSSVRMQFVNEADNTMVTAIMAYDTGTDAWYGTANFSASGRYTLKYLILDGEYMPELDERYQKTLDITLGLTVYVTDVDISLRERFWEGTPYSIPVIVKIYDEGENEVQYLSNVKLEYGVGDMAVGQMDPDLQWDPVKKHYAGNYLITGPGMFEFISVKVDNNPLKTTINTPPVFSCISTDPVEFVDAEPTSGVKSLGVLDYEFAGETRIQTGVRLKNASTAQLTAVFTNAEDGKTYKVGPVNRKAEAGGIAEFVFDIPSAQHADGSSSQGGIWTLERLELEGVTSNVKDASGNYIYHGIGNPLVMNLTPTAENDLKVQIVKVSVVADYADNAVTDYTNVPFLTSQDTGAITITIKDHNGKAIADSGSVKVQYRLEDGSWESKGGYKATHLDNQATGGYVNFAPITPTTADGVTFTVSAVTLPYAGVYHPVLTYTIDGQSFSATGNTANALGMPTFTLSTIKPSATIAAVSPTTSIMTKLTWTANGLGTPTFTASEQKTNSRTDYTATLYASATVDNGGSWGVGNRHGFFAEPSLTIRVSNVPSGWTASMTLPKGTATAAATFSRDGSGDIAKEIGIVSTVKSFGIGSRHYLEGYTGHGNVSITEMTITKGSETYTVELTPLVITNPSSVNQL